MRALRDEGCDCDWVDDDEEWPVCDDNPGVSGLAAGACKWGDGCSGAIRSVALGSEGFGWASILASENGRKGAESSWSSSASDRGPSGGLELE